ncbi:MAG: 16S rRNA (adenine(1518)-N(6)/adenine(1519)-N(6))-dimethyltransferase RsmA [Patescibacteria group bacterium]|nr:16S rRNA (adenine(1518)-N(6)/adenine(1519)-N(6))-dimethyltransferase RsmA [Patescibacteria group bacterium]
MNLTLEQKTKEFLKKNNIRPSKKLGQNFLVDEVILHKIIKASRLTKSDLVVEIGPGIGTLTQELCKVAGEVIAIEKDRHLAKILEKNISKSGNIKILQKDILASDDLLTINNYKIVANLPYNIALPIIRKFVEGENPPQEMILMIQKEVAQKICSEKSSLPKIAIEFYAKSELLFFVPKESFLPIPKVDGAVVRISDIQKNIPKVNQDLFFKILKAGFTHPRKTILNNLSVKLNIGKDKCKEWLNQCSIPLQNRPENLDLKDWLRLTYNFSL